MEEANRISVKLKKFRPSLTLQLRQMASERLRQGLPVFDFGLGETKGELADYIRHAAEQAYREGHTMYGNPAGLEELRQAVLEWLGLEKQYDVENVVVTTGAKQSLFNVFLAICDPADCVLLDSAPWVSYQPLAVAAYGFPVMVLPAAGEASYLKVSGDDLRRNLRMRPHAKLFLLNNPVNPTGQLYTAAEVESLLQVCIEHQIYFVLDRLYWRLLFDDVVYPEPRLDEESRRWIIHIDGMSKNFRRTGGLRIGWSVAPDDVAKAMANLQSHYTSGPSTPAQHAALAAIGRAYESHLKDELEENRDLLQARAGDLPLVKVWPTPATFYSFWDVRQCFGKRTPDGKTIESSDDLAQYLIARSGVVTAPGSAFMQEGYLRISFAVPRQELEAGIAAASRALHDLT